MASFARLRRLLPTSRTSVGDWAATPPSPWTPARHGASGVHCPICQWSGPAFSGTFHSESAVCPQCGAIARDRFLFWCMVARNPSLTGRRLLETSPRLGEPYRRAMSRWFDYTCSDYDLGAHRATVQLDLQNIDRPAASFDVILTPHVLEHVPDTDRALGELHRVLAPGGVVYLQVPVLQGVTAPPSTPEYHGDHTLVFWRFGFDLTARLRQVGFTTTLLCTQQWRDVAAGGATSWQGATSGEFDVSSMLAHVVVDDLTPVADEAQATTMALLPAYQFFTWECRKAAA
jgi:SAM-dependent methyltransferase